MIVLHELHHKFSIVLTMWYLFGPSLNFIYTLRADIIFDGICYLVLLTYLDFFLKDGL